MMLMQLPERGWPQGEKIVIRCSIMNVSGVVDVVLSMAKINVTMGLIFSRMR